MWRAILLFAVLAAACASSQPAEIAYRTGEASADTARSERSAPAPQQPDWAEGEGTPLSNYALQPQDVLAHDPAAPPRTHRVRAGETLYDVAEMHQIPLLALIEQNGLEPPYVLTAGRVIALPPPRFHVVARGESFEDVARRHDVDLRSLALLNRMQPPYRVRPGDRILLPAVARAQVRRDERNEGADAAAAVAPSEPGAGVRFRWPVRGEVVARFGAQPGGGRVDGLEIAAREGVEIRAAADGEVVYSGADLPAYGVLVLVRHADDYVTAYGYARRALVREGDRVDAGEPIAELGSRPDGRARLLFQVRRGAAAVDPAPLLGARD
jgi:murein DD-endopeptidase MepM/ murein hydrolase activator NlpD